MKTSIKYAGITAAVLLAIAPVASVQAASDPVGTVSGPKAPGAGSEMPGGLAQPDQVPYQAPQASAPEAKAPLGTVSRPKAPGLASEMPGGSAQPISAYSGVTTFDEPGAGDGSSTGSGSTEGSGSQTATVPSALQAQADADAFMKQLAQGATYDPAKGPQIPTDKYGADVPVKAADFLSGYPFLVAYTSTDKDLPARLDSEGAVLNITAVANDKSIGSGVLTASDVNKILSDPNGKGVTFTVSFKSAGSDKQPITKSQQISVQPQSVTDESISKLAVTFSSPLNVAVNSSVVNANLSITSDLKFIDQKGAAVIPKEVTPSDKLYTSYKAAVANDGSTGVAADADGIAGGLFTKADAVYYQPITASFDTDSEAGKFLAAYEKDPSKLSLTVNGVDAGQLLDVSLKDGTVTFVRKIVVSGAQDYQVKDIKGVVTTKSDKQYYTLVDDKGNIIKNQALAANTAWLTDQQRTASDGSVQYRVATGEWIDAASVTFSDSSATSSSALTDIQDLQGRHVVSISTPGFVYPLFQVDGSKAGRALAGGTDWLTDKTAKDAEGHVYYRVSTTEWLMEGTGVSFK